MNNTVYHYRFILIQAPLYNNMANNRILDLCNIYILFEKALELE
jgi:hypothetical protein